MNGIDPNQLLEYAIVPALKALGLDSEAARALVLGTAIVESDLRYLHQLGGGPALGLWQCEPATFRDIYDNYVRYKPALQAALDSLSITPRFPSADELTFNLRYAAAICRVHYYRNKAPMPGKGDFQAMAMFHKVAYNSMLGATDPAVSAKDFEKAVAIVGG